LAEVGVLSILRISCSEPNGQEGNSYQKMVAPYMYNQTVCPVAIIEVPQLLNAVKARTEWLDLLK
ncbi:hypothetical protein T4B_10134, partial [Trichinella pseudospiralis]